MKYILRILTPALVFLLFFHTLSASGQEQQEEEPWTGWLKDGTVITKEDLSKILAEHEQWVKSDGKEGQRANLTNAVLEGANLTKANLAEADLTNADLEGADLADARLAGANLTKANLERANLTGANLWGADLTNAYLERSDLTDAVLAGANLTKANLERANLTGANLERADLNDAYLRGANLTNVDLEGADLTDAGLAEADLTKAYLERANLTKASLERADLTDAYLRETKLNKAKISFANLANSIFEPENIEGLIFLGVRGFSSIEFHNFEPVVELRKKAKESGLRNEERALTAALRKHRLRGARFHLFEVPLTFDYFLFDLPTDSGASPWRSLIVLCGLILVFSIPYLFFLRREGGDGIWQVWNPERMRKDLGEKEPMRLTLRGWTAMKVGFYFSILSAFSIGWRELNVGNWIARIQRYEFNYRATGWARAVSGIQSLLSVYLLALWALTYFGRPFE